MAQIMRIPEHVRQMLEEDKCVVMFSSPTCNPCVNMYPILRSVVGLRFAVVDVTEYQSFASEYRVRALPTIALFIRGGLSKMFVGSMSAAALEKWVSA